MIVAGIAAFTAMAFCAGSLAQPFENRNQQTYQDAASKVINETVDQSKFQNLGGGVLWRYRFGASDTRYIRFRFDNIHSPPGATYTIRIVQEPVEAIVASYTAAQFAKDRMLITGLLPPGSLRVELVAGSPPTDLIFRLESALWQVRPALVSPQSFLPNFEYVNTLPTDDPGRSAAQAVATVYLLGTSCTGILIDRETVVTNFHCLEKSYMYKATANTTSPSCADILVEFDYLTADQRGPNVPCRAVRAKPELDTALLTIDPSLIRLASGEERPPINVRPNAVSKDQTAYLIQHPYGLPLVIVKCSIKQVEQEEVLHNCNSTPGSSGSPLLDEKMRWSGLHYKGPYPDDWTDQQKTMDFLTNGPRYNRAKASEGVWKFAHP